MNICFLCYQKNNNNETKVTSMWQLTLSKSFTWICVKLLWLPTSLSTESGSHGYQPILALGVDPKTKVNHPAWDSLEWKCNRVATAAKSLQSCPTLCDPMDCILPGSSVHGVLQARILEWVAMLSSRGSSWSRDWTHVSYISCIGRQVLYHWCICQNMYMGLSKLWELVMDREAWCAAVYEFTGVGHNWVTELNWTEMSKTN